MKRARQNREALKGSRKKYFRARRNVKNFRDAEFPDSDPKVVEEIRQKMIDARRKKEGLIWIILGLITLSVVLFSIMA